MFFTSVNNSSSSIYYGAYHLFSTGNYETPQEAIEAAVEFEKAFDEYLIKKQKKAEDRIRQCKNEITQKTFGNKELIDLEKKWLKGDRQIKNEISAQHSKVREKIILPIIKKFFGKKEANIDLRCLNSTYRDEETFALGMGEDFLAEKTS